MSKIATTCPSCQADLKVPPDAMGRKVKCPKCKAVVRLPALDSPTASTAKSKPNDSKPSESKPNESKPNESKPNESKPNESSPPAVSGQPLPNPKQTTAQVPSRSPSANVPVVAQPSVKKPRQEKSAPETQAGNSPLVMAKPIVPMAKLISPKAVGVSDGGANPSDASLQTNAPSLNVSLGGSVPANQAQRVKFKRRRTNPWPTILLAVGAFGILGLAVVIISLMQGGRSATTASGMPEFQYVADSKIDLGKTVLIPVAVVYPTGMSEEQKMLWKVRLGEENPADAKWDAANSQLAWSPQPDDAGKTHSLSLIIQNTATSELNLGKYQVAVPTLPLGATEVYSWLKEKAAQATVTPPASTSVLSGTWMTFSIDGNLVIAFVYNDPVVAANDFAQLQEKPGSIADVVAKLGKAYVGIKVGSAILIATQNSAEMNDQLKDYWSKAEAQMEWTQSDLPDRSEPNVDSDQN